MEEQNGWKIVKKAKKTKNPKNIVIDDDIIHVNKHNNLTNNLTNITTDNLPQEMDSNKNGHDLPLSSNYILWCHDIHNKDWSLNGYTKLCNISNISEFWKLFNNLGKIGYKVNNFFFMKDGTDPTWEHVNNRDGGICSFRTDMDSSLKMYEDLCSRMVYGNLTANMNDINGISFSPKNNWTIIKIWNKDRTNDLSKTLNPYILNTYKDASIKYKENEPEY